MKMSGKHQAIEGVIVAARRRIIDERGAVYHMLRSDDPEFDGFGEIYFSLVNSGMVKAWKWNEQKTSRLLLLHGNIRLVIFDDRSGSLTRGKVCELVLSETSSQIVIIPPKLWYGFMGLGGQPSLVANCASKPHDPVDSRQKRSDDPYFPYQWPSNQHHQANSA